MSKELEEVKTLKGFNQVELKNDKNVNKSLDVIEKALKRLEAIDNAKPNEAMECLKSLDIQVRFMGILDVPSWGKYLPTIKQALLKAQEQEKVIEVIKNKEVDMKLFFNALFREQQYKINPLEFYNGSVGYKRLWLTQEEFDLLKRYFE